jgi:hypothetical protein
MIANKSSGQLACDLPYNRHLSTEMRERPKFKPRSFDMKLQLKTIFLTAGLSALLGSSILSAQSQKAVASIPFAYHVGEQTFSPGKYTIGQTQTPGIFLLQQNQTGHAIFMPVTNEGTREKEAWQLTFSCYAGQCSLSQVSMAGDSYTLRTKPFPRLAKNQLGVVALVSVPLLSH